MSAYLVQSPSPKEKTRLKETIPSTLANWIKVVLFLFPVHSWPPAWFQAKGRWNIQNKEQLPYDLIIITLS